MPFESAGVDSWYGRSPGGFEFGVQGFTYGQPIPKSITFFLDNSAMVCDQYGRQIRRAVGNDGKELRFADSAPDGNKEGHVTPRPQFATHTQVLEALRAERINWLAYELRWVAKDGARKSRGDLSMAEAVKLQTKLLEDGNGSVAIERAVACAGFPQLPYEELKKVPDLFPMMALTTRESRSSYENELRKIKDGQMRKDALRTWREAAEVMSKEMEAALAE